MRHLHAPLQLCETGDLAVRNERRDLLLMYRFGHLGISGVQPNSIPLEEIQIATTAKSEAAFPIPFRLK